MAQTPEDLPRGSMLTGASCTAAGPYYSNRNAKVVVFLSPGQAFPPDTDGASTTWTLLTETSRFNDGQLVV